LGKSDTVPEKSIGKVEKLRKVEKLVGKVEKVTGFRKKRPDLGKSDALSGKAETDDPKSQKVTLFWKK